MTTQPPTNDATALAEQHAFVQGFGDHYGYDTTYMHELADHSPAGFTAFQNFLPMGSVREALPVDAYYVAKLVSMRVEDCGACFQLNVRMAIEAGVKAEVVKATFTPSIDLEPRLQRVADMASQITPEGHISDELRAALESEYTKEQMLEFGLAIASTKVYPAIKRVLGYAHACDLPTVAIAGPVDA